MTADPMQRAHEIAMAAVLEASGGPLSYVSKASKGNWPIWRAALLAAKAAITREEEVRGWQDMTSAPRDGTYILAIVAPNRGRHLEHQAGRIFAIRHEGLTEPSGYDMGWAVYPGFGGATDHDFACWQPLPAPPAIRADREGVK